MPRKSNDDDNNPARHAAASEQAGRRIAKVMARAGLASRREAETWIAAGRVAVNGAVITSPAIRIGAEDAVTVDGKPLPRHERTRLFLFHKPRGLVTTTADPEGRPTIFDALPKRLPRLVTVGRLDVNTEGLLLLTNDGGLARVLEHPQTGWLRRYRVRAYGSVAQAELDALRDGVTIEGVHYGPIEAALERVQGSNVWLTFAIREGKNREVRNVLGALDLSVNRLIRISFGPFQLGELAEGAVEEVRTRVLRDQLGKKIAALADADFDAPLMARDEPRADRKAQTRHAEERPPRSGLRPAREQSPRSSKGDRLRTGSLEARQGHRPSPTAASRKIDRGSTRDQRHAPHNDGDLPQKVRPWRGRGRDRPIAEQATQNDVPRPTKAGLLTDRKGRRVLVQRVQPEQRTEPEPAPPRAHQRGKAARDRRHGPRPSRPSPAREDKGK